MITVSQISRVDIKLNNGSIIGLSYFDPQDCLISGLNPGEKYNSFKTYHVNCDIQEELDQDNLSTPLKDIFYYWTFENEESPISPEEYRVLIRKENLEYISRLIFEMHEYPISVELR